MLDSIYHMRFKLIINCIFGLKTSRFCGGGGGGGRGGGQLNLPKSYTWSKKKMTYSCYLVGQKFYIFIYCSLIFIYPLCCL